MIEYKLKNAFMSKIFISVLKLLVCLTYLYLYFPWKSIQRFDPLKLGVLNDLVSNTSGTFNTILSNCLVGSDVRMGLI